jgi:hypothetical protein
MNRFATSLSVLAAALAGCTSPGPNNPASASMAPAAQPVPYWAGTGVVQSVTPAPGPDKSLQRLRIRMDDGRTTYVDTPSRDFSAGTRVQLTDNNEIRRL